MRYTQGRPLLSGTDYNGCFYLNGTGWGQLDLAMVVATELSTRLKSHRIEWFNASLPEGHVSGFLQLRVMNTPYILRGV